MNLIILADIVWVAGFSMLLGREAFHDICHIISGPPSRNPWLTVFNKYTFVEVLGGFIVGTGVYALVLACKGTPLSNELKPAIEYYKLGFGALVFVLNVIGLVMDIQKKIWIYREWE